MSSDLELATLTCQHCEATVPVGSRFCTGCGEPIGEVTSADEMPTTVLVGEATVVEPVRSTPTPMPAPTRGKGQRPKKFTGRARKYIVGVVAACLVVGLGAAGYVAYLDRLEYKQQVAAAFSDAEDVASQAIADLTQARRTSDVRAVAARAADGSTALDQYIGDLGEQESAKAAAVNDALTDIGALVALDADTLGQWPSLRSQAEESLIALSSSSGSFPVARVGQALGAVDQLVDRGRRKLAKWRDAVAVAKSERRSDLANFDSYVVGMRGQIDYYFGLRDDTAADLDAIPGVYYTSDVYPIFSSSLDDRIGVLDAIGALNVPAELSSQHAGVTAAISDGVDGMAQLLDALTENDLCPDYECYLQDQPSWQQFQSISDQVSADYGAAVDRWEASLTSGRDEIENRELPVRPVV